MQSFLVGSEYCVVYLDFVPTDTRYFISLNWRLDRITQTSKELSKSTGRTCIPAQVDVRDPQTLKDAVAKTIEKFGKIDFVICGKWTPLHHATRAGYNFNDRQTYQQLCFLTGAAGNFLAPISGLSENAFRTVIEIDTVSV